MYIYIYIYIDFLLKSKNCHAGNLNKIKSASNSIVLYSFGIRFHNLGPR